MLLLCGLLFGCGKKGGAPASRERYQLAMARLSGADSPERRFYALGNAAKESFNAGKVADAQKHADELMALLPSFRDNREYGSAMHDANMVLGRVAVRNGQIEDAKRYLLAAGQSPLTPAMASGGPNMSLAYDLLAKGERQVVQDYLEECRKIWVSDEGRLDKWTEEIKSGKTPDFGPNLSN